MRDNASLVILSSVRKTLLVPSDSDSCIRPSSKVLQWRKLQRILCLIIVWHNQSKWMFIHIFGSEVVLNRYTITDTDTCKDSCWYWYRCTAESSNWYQYGSCTKCESWDFDPIFNWQTLLVHSDSSVRSSSMKEPSKNLQSYCSITVWHN